MSDEMYEFGSFCLGSLEDVVSWRRERDPTHKEWGPEIIVHTCMKGSEGTVTPAQSCNVVGVDALVALRGAIDEALKGYEEGPHKAQPQEEANAHISMYQTNQIYRAAIDAYHDYIQSWRDGCPEREDVNLVLNERCRATRIAFTTGAK